MYCDFYQLVEKPFNVTPDPKFLYLNARYREALAALNYGIAERKGFITLIGEAGTGKTTLLNRLLEELDQRTKTVLIFNTNVTFEEILEYVFSEFDLPVSSGKKLHMIQRLNAFLLEELRQGGNVALLIDEAQDLDLSVLEDLRLLSNLETAKEKILQIVLSGQPELGEKLSSPALRQLRQRIAVNCRLLPLAREEMSEYIRFRLEAAGCPDPRVFSREAEDEIWQLSRGIPRLVNIVCDNALVIGYALGKREIGPEVVREAGTDLVVPEPARAEEVAAVPGREVSPSREVGQPRRSWRERRSTWATWSVLLLALAVGAFTVFRMLARWPAQESVPPASVRVPPRGLIRPGLEGQEPLRLEELRVPPEASEKAATAPPGEPGAGISRSSGSEPSGGGAAARPEEEEAVPGEELALGGVPRGPATGPGAPPEKAESGVASEGAGPARGMPAALAEKSGAEPAGHPGAPKGGEREELAKLQAGVAAAESSGSQAGGALAETRAEVRHPLVVEHAPEGGREGEAAHARVPPQISAEQAGAVTAPSGPEATGARRGEGEYRLVGAKLDSVIAQLGDSMGRIAARKYGQASYTVLDLLKLANPGLRDIDRISVGQTIALPELGEGVSVLADPDGRFNLLVYSAAVPERARSLVAALSVRGFPAREARASLGAQKPIYRVLVGPYASQAEAVEVGGRLRRLFREDEALARGARY